MAATPILAHAVAFDAGKNPKGEDQTATFNTSQVSAYAVFDGHGGTDCALWCASGRPASDDAPASPPLLQRFVSGKSLPKQKTIEDAFWQVDAEFGAGLAKRGGHGRNGGGAHAGSTATILVVEKVKRHASRSTRSRSRSSDSDEEGGGGLLAADAVDGSGGLRCLFAWVGDSTGVSVDMANGNVRWCTTDHKPDAPSEAANLALLSQLSNATAKTSKKAATKAEKKAKKKARKEGATDDGDDDADGDDAGDGDGGGDGGSGDGGSGDGGEGPAGSVADAKDAAEEEVIVPPSRAELEAAIAEGGIKLTASCEIEVIERAMAREALISNVIPKGRKYRRNALVYRRPKKKDENEPLVVATHEDPYSSHYRDLLMTRSICDWTKSSWVLPQPELLAFSVPAGTHIRVILASDGLWDVIAHDQAAAITRAAQTVEQAANNLLAHARSVYDARGADKFGDDTTVMVVDLNPSALNVGSADGVCGCCAQ